MKTLSITFFFFFFTMFEPLTKLIIKNIVNKSFKKELETANSGNSQTQIILLFFFLSSVN